MSINKVILVGNVGSDPEIRSTQDGREIANFSLATSESWTDKRSGEKQEKTEWHRVVVFSSGLAGIVKSYVKKGSKLYIEGTLQTRKWTDKQAIERYTTEIVLQNFNSTLQIVSGGARDGATQEQGNRSRRINENKRNQVEVEDYSEDDDIPF
jgi:single-strand DNA-binding protein